MKIHTAAVLIGLFGAGPVLAQPGPLGVDTDGDGLISRAEAEAALDARFARLDTNGDGALSREELRAGRMERREEMRDRVAEGARERFESADADGDGALSLAELQAVRPGFTQERFAALDRNGDGLITPDERPERRPGRRGGRFGPPPGE